MRSEIERIEKKVVEGTHVWQDVGGRRSRPSPAATRRPSASKTWHRINGCVECHHVGKARDADSNAELSLHIMKWQIWYSIKHLHLLYQGRWSRLISRCHGWWNTCLKSSSRQHSLRRSCALFAEFVFLMLRCWIDFMRRESEYFGRNQSAGVITSCADHCSGFWSVRYQYPELGSRASLRILIKMYLISIPRLAGLRFAFWLNSVMFLVRFVSMLYAVSIWYWYPELGSRALLRILIKFCSVYGSIYPCCMLYLISQIGSRASHSDKVQICFWKYLISIESLGPGLRFPFWLNSVRFLVRFVLYPYYAIFRDPRQFGFLLFLSTLSVVPPQKQLAIPTTT